MTPNIETELRQHCEMRKYEREVFESALKEWLLQSGLGPIMMEQMEDFARQAGIEAWPEQFEMYKRDFDTRNPRHREIAEYINDIE